MDGPVEFHDCDDVTTLFMDGGSDEAGFVQVIQGKRRRPRADQGDGWPTPAILRAMRPEIIGGTLALEPDGTFIRDDRVHATRTAPGRARSDRAAGGGALRGSSR